MPTSPTTMHPMLFKILRIIYPIDLPDNQRDRPLQVLALGISRSGTESLRQALLELGYIDCYHGFRYGASSSDALQWIRLGHAQEAGDNEFLNTNEFDRIFGDCAAITDIPSAGFAHELVALYPDATIILNYREDVDAWYQSCVNTIEKATEHEDWYSYFLTFFEPHLFWRERSFYWVWRRHFGGDFEEGGKKWYLDHYQGLERALPPGSYLKWKVEDGWEPLCKFLGKPTPHHPFPKGNVPEDFMKTVVEHHTKWKSRAERTLRITAVALGAFVAAATSFAVYVRR